MLTPLNHTRTGGAFVFGLIILWIGGCAEPVGPLTTQPRAEEKRAAAAQDEAPDDGQQHHSRASAIVSSGRAGPEEPSAARMDARGVDDEPVETFRESDTASPLGDEPEAKVKADESVDADAAEAGEMTRDAGNLETDEAEQEADHRRVDGNDDKVKQPTDAGAVAFFEQLKERLDIERDVKIDPETAAVAVGLSPIKNMSRAQNREFTRFKNRLATLLSRAGEQHGVRFIADGEAEVAYELSGSAYLIMIDGFNFWELHLTLESAERAWTIWRVSEPVYVLRTERQRSQQVFLGTPDRR